MMKKLLGIMVLGLLLSGCATDKPCGMPCAIDEYFKINEKAKIKEKEKSLNCKNEVKDMTGSEAIEKYEECLKRK